MKEWEPPLLYGKKENERGRTRNEFRGEFKEQRDSGKRKLENIAVVEIKQFIVA